jgi:hypothetical protein
VILLSRRGHLALAAVVDIAIHARPLPIAQKLWRYGSNAAATPKGLLQSLVHANILKVCAVAQRL